MFTPTNCDVEQIYIEVYFSRTTIHWLGAWVILAWQKESFLLMCRPTSKVLKRKPLEKLRHVHFAENRIHFECFRTKRQFPFFSLSLSFPFSFSFLALHHFLVLWNFLFARFAMFLNRSATYLASQFHANQQACLYFYPKDRWKLTNAVKFYFFQSIRILKGAKLILP